MNPNIEAILFDIGGTLQANQPTGGRDLEAVQKIQAFIGDKGDPQEFAVKIRSRELKYRRWAIKTLIELREPELWTKYLLPEYPPDFVRENAVTLNQFWREWRVKLVLPDAVDTIRTLAERGYTLGIISNTTSSLDGPRMLKENGIDTLFSTVILSTVFGRRKPHPSLFIAAAKEIGVLPERCAYIGDQLSRDLIGARQAGYGAMIIIDINGYHLDGSDEDDEFSRDELITAIQPDVRIGQLRELLELFPGRKQVSQDTDHPVQLYDAALSTMWGVDQKMPLNQTFELGRKAGFPRFELNRRITPELYTKWDSTRYYVSTVHDPCPAEFMHNELEINDFLISSLDERRRRKGTDQIRMTIDTACSLGARSVVIHPGMVMGDRSLEDRLRELYGRGLKGSPEYDTAKKELIAHRAGLVQPHLEQVSKSLSEVIEYARPTGIELAIENRYHYYDIPILDEMQILLDLCDEDWYGFQYDCGHAQALHELGLCDHEEWLRRFGKRIIGVHLHDVIGIQDHKAPGDGDLDFTRIAPYIPEAAYRTVEVGPHLSLDKLRQSLEVLAQSGCVMKV